MAASADTATPSNWIYVRDVPETATEDSLKKAFGTFGAIKSVDFSAGRNYQYVEFNSADAATKASSVASNVDGKPVVVEVRKRFPHARGPRAPREPREHREPREPRERAPRAAAPAHGSGSEDAERRRRPRRVRVPGATVAVLGLSPDTQRQDLRTAFAAFGRVSDVRPPRREGGPALVSFDSVEASQAAVAQSGRVAVGTQTVTIEVPRPRPGTEGGAPLAPRQPREPREPREEAPRMRRPPRAREPAAAGAAPREPREPREPRAPRAPRQSAPAAAAGGDEDRTPLYWVFVAKAPREARREDVKDALSHFGPVKVATYQRGFYYVGFESEEAQQKAIAGSETVNVQDVPVVIEKRSNFRPLKARSRRDGAPDAPAQA